MRTYKQELEFIASDLLEQNAVGDDSIKPNYTKREFFNALIIFQTALMDKMYDHMINTYVTDSRRVEIACNCGFDLNKLILEYTGLDVSKIEEFV